MARDDAIDESERIRVVELLLRFTKDGRVSWRIGDYHDKSELTLGRHFYELASEDQDGYPPYRLSVTEVGKQHFTRSPFYAAMKPSDEEGANQELNELLRELYEIAYRQSRRDESKVDDILSELEEIDREPPF
jgi:hypothetical protein